MNIEIKKLLTDADGGVTQVFWELTASKNGINLKEIGNTKFTPNSVLPGFIAYDKLSESDVKAWVEKSINMEAIERRLAQAAADASIKPAALPWASAS